MTNSRETSFADLRDEAEGDWHTWQRLASLERDLADAYARFRVTKAQVLGQMETVINMERRRITPEDITEALEMPYGGQR